MQFRIPWILSRKRLAAGATLDAVLFGLLYYCLYFWRFGSFPNVSLRLGVLLSLWLLSSYVIGRYTSGSRKDQLVVGWSLYAKQMLGTACVLSLSLGISLLHIWLFNQDPVQATFRSFLLPFLASLGILSSNLQYLFSNFVSFRRSDYSDWLYVGSSEGFQELQELLKWSRLSVHIKHINTLQLPSQFDGNILVDYFYDCPKQLLLTLYRLQQSGSYVISKLNWCELVLQRFPSELLHDADLLAGDFLIPQGTLPSRIKRSADVFVAALLLILTTPLLLISAVLIKITDNGPVLYSQIRIGFAGKPFRIWKLRSMKINAEKNGAQWSARSDCRITKIGAILRRTRLDELPQLWCVLIGTMSLIGPRPERPEFDKNLINKVPYYSLRYLIRPGLSGWAQVNYPYGASIEDSANKLSYDLYYLRNSSFWLDLLILFKTIRLVFNAEGAIPLM